MALSPCARSPDQKPEKVKKQNKYEARLRCKCIVTASWRSCSKHERQILTLA